MPIGDLLAQISGDVQPSLPSTKQPAKRKAEEDLRYNGDKVVRREQAVVSPSKSVMQIERSQPLAASVPKMKSSFSASAQRTANPVPSSSSTGPSPATAPRFDPAKPPKKGSYAEIMARGKAAQATLGQVGKISHKPVEKPISKRERQELLEHQRASEKPKKVGGSTTLRDGRNGIRENNGKAAKPVHSEPSAPEKKAKKAAMVTTGYTGTARPNPALSKTARPSSKQRSGSSSSPNQKSSLRSHRYAYASEDDEEEEDYDSEASSDMEAAVYEVDEEEERAAQIARKEDADALREENRLKREKEEKRQKLAAIIKSRQKH